MDSTVGVIIRQGPHHSAQKSTSTGTSAFSTSLSNSASVKVRVLSPAIFCSRYGMTETSQKLQAASSLHQKLTIQRRVLGRGCIPREVLTHGPPHNLPPRRVVAVRGQSNPNGP